MNVLLCNDDGIHAPGIAALYDAVRDMADVHIVAPEAERSAVGHAITIYNPLKTKKVYKDGAFYGYAVEGTPADCVKLAVSALLPKPPDFILSGINLGPNAGINVLYSGTVSAATEGTILGIPSMAISINTFTNPLWDTAKIVAREVLERFISGSLPPETLVNVNVPNLPYEELKGTRITSMGRSRYHETFERRTDPRGNEYFWMDGELKLLDENGDTDLRAIEEGYVSLTPLGLDLTRHSARSHFEQYFCAKD